MYVEILYLKDTTESSHFLTCRWRVRWERTANIEKETVRFSVATIEEDISKDTKGRVVLSPENGTTAATIQVPF